jgi:membrane fusion protein, copper/silver efflux system
MNRTRIVLLGGVALVAAAAVALYLVTAHDRTPAAETAAATEMPRYRVGALEVGIATDPATPRVGANTLTVEVRDANGVPLTGVRLDAFAEMGAMGAMAAMRAPVDLEEVAPGRYEGTFDLSMRGEWPLTVRIKDPQQGDQRLQLDLATDRKGVTLSAGGIPIGGAADADLDAAVITIDNRRRQLIGVETGTAAVRDLKRTIRAVGRVAYDERSLSTVTLKFDGYIGKLTADYVGVPIRRGAVLFTVYSPELLAAQREYLETRRRLSRRGNDDVLLHAARERLALWDLSASEIAALERRGEPQDFVPMLAPRGGTLVEKNIVAGSAARMGQPLLRIADLSRVWIDADVYEGDLESVTVGSLATITLPYVQGRTFEARVDYVYPYLQAVSRTGRVRLTLDNPDGRLKPDMYAEVALQVDLGQHLSVPEEAVLIAGDRRVVFVDLGDGRLKPVHIKTGRRAEGFIAVLEGLSAGDAVVTSGNFLVAAETKLKAGIEQW